ncbi:bifunctional 2-C-methyl-D-erythritol 4-phosphate cytidylyltransferase/2-C-methyl-D-erythritol 2,4-cyclodiphosphate synthase [Novosphingobium sp. TH158]|uniref:bifunctional 2-C-methyl-D-erythritol 4-phosphate cytidylyltransferase/2-C-methyl-D-erythritol 2,4-cyclodiphosphate synthase n=1 Tax=Novosphingobium sp. TH158 TaxID=2067455 RepID=UPI000C7B9903|nr:bifunctional 2-C-methyl-D-erythritol 4-phosphate cytidylyltransferase/2-C-methyl-D-erythritol 2,4-cyclodiphosphate synthase [Novosphingobium sp. TH158]PLK25854.1 bifunctional 2-C-methyl-D-erythritol 4-phosphate cytidylyltransferase/2-C-methyl-D-erythritol 2,4-cyclodiphosphate synthase [Novosphingobium sp. TH158]
MERIAQSLPGLAAVIVAAGAGLRAGQPVPKQFAPWRGKPLLRHAAERFAAEGISPIVVAVPEGAEAIAEAALAGIPGARLVTGGATRQASVRAALESLEADAPSAVLIHDAARPDVPVAVLERLLDALARHDAAIPVLPVIDSLTQTEGAMMGRPARREELRRVQTPQAFRYPEILAAHRAWSGEPLAGDDAQVAQAAGIGVALVEGDEVLKKLTTPGDFAQAPTAFRVGSGYDVHRLVEGEDLWLCGARIDHSHGLAGHSDADVAIHALVDAILGAAGDGDIGRHFPPSDPQWKGASSDRFLAHAVQRAAEAGWSIGNVDLTIICEAPKIGPHREAMRARLAEIMGVDIGTVSVKATTTEGLGSTGRREGIAAQAVALLVRN